MAGNAVTDQIVNLVNRALWHLASRYGYLLARYRCSAVLSIGAIASEYYLNFYKNRSYNRVHNGEDRLVSLLGLKSGDVFCDVGAHHGEYARYVKQCYPNAEIHCFELSPGNIRTFRANSANAEAGLHLQEFGLGIEEGSFETFESPQQSQVVSLHSVAGGIRGETGRVRRGDAACRELGITNIAFLKIDTEGHELQVLQGFGEMLRPDCIACIQFEYNECSVSARVLIRELFELLEPAGYVVGKIYPRAVEFGPYSFHLEDHRASNYCAVGKGTVLERRLAGEHYWTRALR